MQQLTLRAAGLYTFPNPLSQVPPGALLTADNIVIDREGIIESRRGFNLLDGNLGTNSTDVAAQLLEFGNFVLSHYGPLGVPTTMAFNAGTTSITGVITVGSNVISNITSTANLYVNQFISEEVTQQTITGNATIGTNTITSVLSSQGVIVGQSIGGMGIPLNTTITSISGSSPYTITISNNTTATNQGLTFTATNTNVLPFTSDTQITAISANSLTVSNNASQTSRALNFLPSNVTAGSNGIITIPGHGFVAGQSIEFSTTGTLPAPLTSTTEYFAVDVTDTTFDVALTSTGNPIAFSSVGTGTHTVTERESIDCFGWVNYNNTINQPAPGVKMRSTQTSGNLYVTTSTGIQKLDAITNQFIPAGVPDGLDGQATLNPADAGFMSPNVQVAYRIVWGYTDANNNLILGVPSQRIVVANTTQENKNIDLEITIPQGITIDYFMQAYRSGFSSDENTEPNDEMALVYEINPSADQLAANSLSFTDETPESLRTGAALYTSPSQQGITQENNAPPFATDITFFKGSTFYSNTKTKQNFQLSLLAVSGQYSVLGDIITGSNTVINLNSTITANSTANSNTLTSVSDTTNIGIGQTINSTVTFTGDITTGSVTVLNATPTTFLAVGETIIGTGIPIQTTIIAISGTTLTISNAAIATTVGNSMTAEILPDGTTIVAIPSSTTVILSSAALVTTTASTFVLTISGVFIGQIVSGTGIPSGTLVTQVYFPFQFFADVPASSDPAPNILLNVTNIGGFLVGQTITGPNIPTNSTITAIDITNSKLTISNASTASTAVLQESLNAITGVQLSNAVTSTATQTQLTFQNGQLGIQIGDSITIANTTFTAGATENIATKQFKIYAQGSPAQNINDTALSLIRVINQSTSPAPTIYAYYQSASNTLPGMILFQERVYGGGIFYFTASSTRAGATFSPTLPVSGTSVASTNDSFVNGLYYSKTQQPEAVPLLNFVQVGSSNSAILRCIPLRDSLFILKDEGIYRLTGTDPTNFSLDLFDSTTKIKSAESAVSLNNVIYMLSEYGVVTVSDTGVTVVSRAIEDSMLNLFEQSPSKAAQLTFGISYESDRKYIMFCITNAADITPTQAFVYNTFTNTWTRWILNQTAGIVHPELDLLFLGNANGNNIDEERKLRTYTDYVDDSFDINIISYSGNNIVIDNTTNAVIGNVVWQTPGRFSLITAVNLATSTVTVKDSISSWTLGPAAILEGIKTVVEYVPVTAQNPGAMKQVRETTCIFLTPQFYKLNVSFNTDLSPANETITLSGQYGLLWGLFPWGTVPWGGVATPIPLRTYVPLQKQRCSQLNVTITHNEAYAFYRLSGISFIYNDPSERVGI